jgi:hypothetical protein
VSLRHGNFEVALDLHVFEVHDFNILIGHPLEKLFLDVPILGKLDVKLGKDSFSVPISHSKNIFMEPPSRARRFEKVMAISPFVSPESSLEKITESFIEEEDELLETLELPKHEKSS